MCGNRRILEKCKKYMNKFGEYAVAGTEGDFRIQAGYGIMNARHKRKGKALPKPGRSLTAAIAARCAAKTWPSPGGHDWFCKTAQFMPRRALNNLLVRNAGGLAALAGRA